MRVLTAGNMYPPHHHGGYELVWQSAVQHLRERGHDVRVLTTDYRTATAESEAPNVFREFRWHLRDGQFDSLGPRAVMAMARHNHRVLARHVDDFRPDVVGWWSMGGLTLTMLESIYRSDIPAVAFVHDDWLDYGPSVDPWLRAFTGPRRGRLARAAERVARIPTCVDFRAASDYVFVSEFTRGHALGLGHGLDPARTSVAHSGIHPDFLNPAPPAEWGWRLLYVGRLDPRKGVDTAVDALALLPRDSTLTIIGGWDEREEARLAALAADRGVGERVVFAGERERADLAEAYEAADVVVFPVRWNEPWGLVPLEAMAKGRPVVATGRGGSGEYLRDGENCLLFEADDASELAAAVRRLAGDAVLRERLRNHGLNTVARHTEPVFNEAVEDAVTRHERISAASRARRADRGPAGAQASSERGLAGRRSGPQAP